MKDPEFYTVSEGWPQPPDEDCTLLEGQTITAAAKPKKKAAGRVRKKLSESLAGVTAAAIAVVLVANSLPGLKDVVDDSLIEDIFGEICPLCNVENCPYYFDGQFGLTLSYDNRPEYLEYDLYKMNGYTERDRDSCENCRAIITADSQRLVFYADKELDRAMDGHQHWGHISENVNRTMEGLPSVTGFSVTCYDEKSDERMSVFYVYLIYAADGDFSGYDLAEETLRDDVDIAALDFRAFDVEGVPNTQIHIYTDLGEAFINEAIGYCHVDVADGPGVRYPLGQTMYFQETENWYRTYADEKFSWSSTYGFEEGDIEVYRYFFSDLNAKRYFVTDPYGSETNITFAVNSWVDIFEKYAQLNEDAPKYGHEVYFPIIYVGEATVNEITYLCYAGYMDDTPDESDKQWATFLLVPKQEPNIVLAESYYASPEELTALATGEMPAEYMLEVCYAGLSQITKR